MKLQARRPKRCYKRRKAPRRTGVCHLYQQKPPHSEKFSLSICLYLAHLINIHVWRFQNSNKPLCPLLEKLLGTSTLCLSWPAADCSQLMQFATAEKFAVELPPPLIQLFNYHMVCCDSFWEFNLVSIRKILNNLQTDWYSRLWFWAGGSSSDKRDLNHWTCQLSVMIHSYETRLDWCTKMAAKISTVISDHVNKSKWGK